MKGKVVVGIDVGWANHACCVLGDEWKQPLRWTNERIMSGTYTEDRLWAATMTWCQIHEAQLNAADMIVLERQHEPPLRMMNIVIRTLYKDKVQIVSPKTISARFKLSHVRQQKKQDAMKLVGKNIRIPTANKQDDLADAFLLAIWGREQLGQETEGWKI